MISPALRAQLEARHQSNVTRHAPSSGGDIFGGGDWPRSFREFVGQEDAVARLKAAIRSAKDRGAPLDHVLLASGVSGIGKSSLARLIAAELGHGFSELSGKVSADDARTTLLQMKPHDVLFLDELGVGTTRGLDWLLTLLQEGRLVTRRGAEQVAPITVVAATTDVGKLPLTIINRFLIQPVLAPYSPAEGAKIAQSLGNRLDVKLSAAEARAVAAAGDYSPRQMRQVITALRDTEGNGSRDFDLALRWCGYTADGLTQLSQDYLQTLLGFGGKAGERTMAAALSEPATLRHTEQTLILRGFLTVEAGGRRLTAEGIARAEQLLEEIFNA